MKEIENFHNGVNYKSAEILGAKIEKDGVLFTTWAPSALQVNLLGDFNQWKTPGIPLKTVNTKGVWQVFVVGATVGQKYMFETIDASSNTRRKADPFATFATYRPERASVIYDLSGYNWADETWLNSGRKKNWLQKPINIYEIHAGSWKRKADGQFYTYLELADDLIPYVKAHGYTHIEIMPLTEHPYDGSWGYQSTGYISPTSRYGTPHDLMSLVDKCHQANIGVLLDWVPGHFCKDEHGLYLYDGSSVFEYTDERERENLGWGTANFDLSKPEVQSFLISSALYWLDKFHFDGFRMDAVANMLYWQVDGETGENPFGVKFLQKLNQAIMEHFPHAIICAEDSTTWPNVTKSVEVGGLGFTFKWKMGWMNDVLAYMQTPFHERKYHHNKLTFGMWYAYSEKYILPFSHDEVVHLKKSMLEKMPGTDEEKFAQLRLLYCYMFTHPGKKLLFMGQDFGQRTEWSESVGLPWELLENPLHGQLHDYTKMLMNFYLKEKPLWELDHAQVGFMWIDVDNNEQSMLSYVRFDRSGSHLVTVCNFLNIGYFDYQIGVPRAGKYVEIMNTNKENFGGTGDFINPVGITALQEAYHEQPYSIRLSIPPFSAVVLKWDEEGVEIRDEK